MLEAPARKTYNIRNSPFQGVFAFLDPVAPGNAHGSAAPGAAEPLGVCAVLVMGEPPYRFTGLLLGAVRRGPEVRRIGSSGSHPIPWPPPRTCSRRVVHSTSKSEAREGQLTRKLLTSASRTDSHPIRPYYRQKA